jgi:S1-C subfamily serine protease
LHSNTFGVLYKGILYGIPCVLLLVVQLVGPWHSEWVYAQDSPAALSIATGEGMADSNSMKVPDLTMLRRLSPIFRNLEKILILEHTRGVKEQKLFRNCAPAVVLVLTNDSIGSGVVIDRSGLVITNHHVVAPYSTVAVVFKPRTGEDLTKDLARKAIVKKIDNVADLALLKIENPPSPISILGLGDSNALEVGMDVHSIGHPEGEIWTYTQGTISALRKNYEGTINGKRFLADVIQHQTPMNLVNSGGPLLNDSCRVLGINTFVKGRDGLNFAVDSNMVRRFLKAPTSRPAVEPKNSRLRCPKNEQYNLVRSGWGIVAGCYVGVKSPPPNWWIIRRTEQDEPYMTVDLDHNGSLDTARIRDSKEGGYFWASDNDCDGLVDAVGHQSMGSSDIESYAQPQRRIVLTELIPEINNALRSEVIPHSNLQVCQ